MAPSNSEQQYKALIFDLMGTCLDWHSSIATVLDQQMIKLAQREQSNPPAVEDHSRLTLEWRQGFFDEIHARFNAGKDPEDIDETHRRVLQRLLDQVEWTRYARMSDEDREVCIRAWHSQSGM